MSSRSEDERGGISKEATAAAAAAAAIPAGADAALTEELAPLVLFCCNMAAATGTWKAQSK